MMNDEQAARRAEIGRLADLIRAGNATDAARARFQELLQAEIQPAVNAAIPRIAAAARDRQRRRERAIAAGVAAGRREAARMQLEREDANHRQKR